MSDENFYREKIIALIKLLNVKNYFFRIARWNFIHKRLEPPVDFASEDRFISDIPQPLENVPSITSLMVDIKQPLSINLKEDKDWKENLLAKFDNIYHKNKNDFDTYLNNISNWLIQLPETMNIYIL
jgi:hypothetical protein